jgi:hypothetical protein
VNYNKFTGLFVTLSSTGARQKPALDENSFQELLAAAYVVQRHKEAVRVTGFDSGPGQVLSVIAEIQSQIRTRGLDIPAAAALVAERALELTGGSGVSVGVISESYLKCVAEAGELAAIPGRCISSHSLVATERLKAGGIFESDNSRSDMRLDLDLCRSLGVGSLVAAAILSFGEIAGVIEVRWQQEKGFGESELRACRLLAGLMTGTLERSVRIGKTRAAVAEAPAVVGAPGGAAAPEAPSAPEPIEFDPEVAPQVEKATQWASAVCRMCGKPFSGGEAFCGFCSMPRPAESSSAQLQSKWASLWFMQRAQGALQAAPVRAVETPVPALPAQQSSTPVIEPQVVIAPPEPTPLARVLQTRAATDDFYASIRTRTEPEPAPSLTPAAETPFPFPEQSPISERATHAARNHWRDAILTSVALTLAFGLVTAWPKSHSQPTWFQLLMVRLGVMQAAPSANFSGNADARVWLDAHTQLYYCQGEDLYGKTPDGEFTTQHNAQSDGYQSASNVACP